MTACTSCRGIWPQGQEKGLGKQSRIMYIDIASHQRESRWILPCVKIMLSALVMAARFPI